MNRLIPTPLRRALRWIYYSVHLRYENVSLGNGVSGRFSRVPCNYGEDPAEANRGYTFVRDIKAGDIVLDAGAYRGMFSVYASKKAGPEGHVFAFEPIPWNQKVLRRNLRVNQCTNVTIVSCALGASDGMLRFSAHGGSSHVDKRGDDRIRVMKMDTFCRRHKVDPKKIRFVKMDVEGAELDVLKGSRAAVRKGSAVWAIASYHIVDGKMTRARVEDFFRNNRYRVKTRTLGQLTTYAWKP